MRADHRSSTASASKVCWLGNTGVLRAANTKVASYSDMCSSGEKPLIGSASKRLEHGIMNCKRRYTKKQWLESTGK